MRRPKLKTKIIVEEYLDGEKGSRERHEFVSGEIFAMAGASERHHRISLNLATLLDRHLADSGCDVFMAEMRLRTFEDDFYYPNVFVSCEKNPVSEYYREEAVLVIEVTSPPTSQIDRREKLKAYQAMPSVQEYILIEQDRKHIELHRRQPDGKWITCFYNINDLDEAIEFQSIGLTTNLDSIYSRVKFPPDNRRGVEPA